MRLRRSGLAFTALCALQAGCASVFAGAGPGLDAGTLSVSGVETGTGAFLEVGGWQDMDAGLGGALSLSFAGYDSDGDADPIGFATGEARWHAPFRGRGAGAYWAVGSGAGVAWAAGVRGPVFPLFGEVGLRTTPGAFMLSAGLRERAMLIIGGGSPPLDVANSIQLVLTVTAGSRRRD